MINDFYANDDAMFLYNEVLDKQRALQIQDLVIKYVLKTIELERIPMEEDLEEQGCGCGGGGSCGCG